MVSKHLEFGCKLFHFHLPVAKKSRRHHHKRTPFGKAPFLFQLQEESNHLERLSKAHVIGQDAPKTHLQVLVHPRITAHLVGAKRRVQVLR